MSHLLAQAVLAHTMAQSTLELLALIGPFAIVFGAGAVLVIGPMVRSQGENVGHQPAGGATESGAAARADAVSAPATGGESPAPVT
jgi:hypothetical protein